MKSKNYNEFNAAKIKCRDCAVGCVYNQVVPSDGNRKDPKVVIIGEACGSEELVEGKPFVGKAGKLLRSTLEEMNFKQENSLITNILPCRPENNSFPTDDNLVKSCLNQWLKEEILLTNPDFLLLVGSKPLKFLLKMEGITKTRGKWYSRKINGKIIRIMPTYHPSFVLRKKFMEEGKQIMEDFRDDIRAVALAARLIK